MQRREDVVALFEYQRPDPERVEKHAAVDQLLRTTALALFDELPASPETTLAIRALHQARFHAHTAIALRTRL